MPVKKERQASDGMLFRPQTEAKEATNNKKGKAELNFGFVDFKRC